MENNKKSINDFFQCLLERMYHAEKEILKQLEILGSFAKRDVLKEGINKHRRDTEAQIERLEKAFKLLESDQGEKKKGMIEKGKEMASNLVPEGMMSKSPSIQGIVKEGKCIFEEFQDTDLHDLVLSSGSQTIEMGEIASYKTLCQIAEVCGQKEILEMLKISLKEEEEQSDWISQITQQELEKLKEEKAS